jgi:hypothetical protein
MFFTSSAIAASKTRKREFEAASGIALPNEQLQSVLLRYAILESEACCTHSKIGSYQILPSRYAVAEGRSASGSGRLRKSRKHSPTNDRNPLGQMLRNERLSPHA